MQLEGPDVLPVSIPTILVGSQQTPQPIPEELKQPGRQDASAKGSAADAANTAAANWRCNGVLIVVNAVGGTANSGCSVWVLVMLSECGSAVAV